MKVKDLSISTKIYSVNADEIISVSIDAIGKINNKIKITIDDYCYDTNEDADEFTICDTEEEFKRLVIDIKNGRI